MVGAVELWKQIVEDETLPYTLRLKASELIVDRCWGRPTERVQMEAEIKEPAWMTVMRRAVHIDGVPAGDHPDVRRAMGVAPIDTKLADPDDEIIDAEIVEDDSPEPEDDPILYEDEDDVAWE